VQSVSWFGVYNFVKNLRAVALSKNKYPRHHAVFKKRYGRSRGKVRV